MSGVVFSVNGNQNRLYFMFAIRTLLLIVVAQVCLATPLFAQMIEPEEIVVCTANDKEFSNRLTLIDRNKNACNSVTGVWKIDPQDKEVWVFATLNVTPQRLDSDRAMGLFVMAKASTEIHLNGEKLGQNGKPALNRADEVVGAMDYVVYVPKSRVKVGSNQLALRMSSHNGLIRLNSPTHFIALADYVNPTDQTLRYYWVTLLPFGVLILGAFYMGMLSVVRRQYWPDLLLPMMSLLAALQLIFEVYRGLAVYPYWVHDLRLILILVCSVLFGLGLISYTTQNLVLDKKRGLVIVGGTMLAVFAIIGFMPGFDLQSMLAIMLPTLTALGLSIYGLFRRSFLPSESLSNRRVVAKRFSCIYAAFLLVLILSAGDFLNITFYYIIAALMVMLFINELDRYVGERNARFEEQARADKLQTILEQNEQRNANLFIRVSGAGSVEQLAIADIAYCKGAGDYVELVLLGAGSVLHSDRLLELEKSLPSAFLRVHRSYIVNTVAIKSLQRKPSGVGELLLTNNDVIPVSRRIMPTVREKLS